MSLEKCSWSRSKPIPSSIRIVGSEDSARSMAERVGRTAGMTGRLSSSALVIISANYLPVEAQLAIMFRPDPDPIKRWRSEALRVTEPPTECYGASD